MELSDGRISKVMPHQYKAATRADHPNLIPMMSDDDMRIWHFLVVNLPFPYIDGEYIFRLVANSNFPADPPKFEFLTENGVYKTGVQSICISVGIFHAGDAPGRTGSTGWRPVLGMIGFAREVVNGMLNTKELDHGIGIDIKSPTTRASLAESSAAYNADRYPELMAKFTAYATDNPTHQAVRSWLMFRTAAQILRMNWQTVALDDDLLPLISKSIEEDLWPVFDTSLRYLLEEIPDIPAAQLVPMGFPANGRTILLRVAAPLRILLREREVSVRRTLGLLLHARICLEFARGEDGGPEAPDTTRQEWSRQFEKGFTAFLEALPEVCGPCSCIVPGACRLLLETPSAFTEDIHNGISNFLCMTDIDKKEKLGSELSTQISLSVSG